MATNKTFYAIPDRSGTNFVAVRKHVEATVIWTFNSDELWVIKFGQILIISFEYMWVQNSGNQYRGKIYLQVEITLQKLSRCENKSAFSDTNFN